MYEAYSDIKTEQSLGSAYNNNVRIIGGLQTK